MPTYTNTFAINGVIDTSSTILSNLQEICKASGCWLSYNIALGKWDVVINTTGSSVKSFDVSNIVGSVSVMTTALTEYYNSVEIEFPHRDLKDTRDFENYSIATGNLLPNERTNLLTISSKLINNPVQAQLIAARELKQSRVDKVIQFTTDYSSLGLQAGDLIDVTLTQYAFNSKVFRITSLEEEDDNEGNLLIRITALEYDANVYSTSGLTYTEKTLDNQIRYGGNNTAITNSNGTSNIFDITTSIGNQGTNGTSATLFKAATLGSGISTIDNEWQNQYSANCATIYQNWINAGCPDQRTSISNIMTTANTYWGISALFSFQTLAGFNDVINIIQTIPFGDITYGGVLRTTYWPHLIVLYYAPFLVVNGQTDTITPPQYSDFIFQEAKQAFTNTQNIIMHSLNPKQGWYYVIMIPYANVNENGSLVNPSSVGTGTSSLFPYASSKVHTLVTQGKVIQ